jgi:hypothetical protein
MVLTLVLLWILTSVSQTPSPGQLPPRDTVRAVEKKGTAVLRGRVLAADTGLPLKRCIVTLQPSQGPPVMRRTDLDGRYEFTQLPVGTYRMTAEPGPSRPAYPSRAFGATGLLPNMGTPIDVAEGQVLERMDFRLPRGGVMTGRVVDDLGDPVANARVTAAQRIYGRATLVSRTAAQTDDLGRFRLFGLQPGDYVLTADGPWDNRPVPNDEPARPLTTYHPGVLSAADASVVTLRGGQELTDLDIQLARGRTYRVSGTVVDSQGRQGNRVSLSLWKRSPFGGWQDMRGTGLQPDGTFTFMDFTPGEYLLQARGLPNVQGGAAVGEYARVPVVLGDADITGLAVVTQPGVSVAGSVVVQDGAAADAIRNLQLSASAAQLELEMGTSTTTRVAADGSFTLSNLIGPVLIRPTGASGFSLKAVMLGGTEITDTPTELKPSDSGRLQIILTQRSSELAGRVTDEAHAPVRRGVVILLSEDRERWNVRAVTTKLVPIRPDGTFRVQGLVAGRYLAVAIDAPLFAMPSNTQVDPQVVAAFARLATQVTIAEGEQRTLDLVWLTLPDGVR